MADKDVKIRIDTEANTQGAKEAQQSIASLKNEAKALEAELETAAIGSKHFEETAEKLGRVEQRIKEAGDQARTFARKSGEAKDSSRNMGGAVLEASRAFEDMQYGIRGVLNNLPVLAAQLGLSSGLAGVISLVAVGASILIPKLLEMGDSVDEPDKKFKGFKETLKSLKEASKDLAQFEAGLDKKSIIDAYNEATRVIDLNSDAIRANLDAFKEALRFQGDVSKRQNQQEIENVQQQASRGEITDTEAERRVDELKRKQAEEELENLRLLGEINVEAKNAELTALEARKQAAETAKKLAKEEVDARKQLLEVLIPRLTQLAQQRDSTAALTSPGSPAGDPNFAEKFEAKQQKLAQIDAEIQKILEELKKSNLPADLESITKSKGWADFSTYGEKIGAAAQSFKDTLEKGDNILKVSKMEEIQKNSDAAANALKALTEDIEKKRQELNQTQAQEAQKFAQESNRLGFNTNDVGVKEAERKGADAIRHILDSIVQSLGEAANSPQNQERIAAITKTLADGLQAKEGDPVLQAIQSLVAQVQKDDGTRAQYVAKVEEVISVATGKIREAMSRLDEYKIELNNLRAQQGGPNW